MAKAYGWHDRRIIASGYGVENTVAICLTKDPSQKRSLRTVYLIN
jgi:hypothetical protein